MIQVSSPKPEPNRQVRFKARKVAIPVVKRKRKRIVQTVMHIEMLTQDKARVAVARNLMNPKGLVVADRQIIIGVSHHGTRRSLSASISASNGRVIWWLKPHKGPVYPLRHSVFVRYLPHPEGVRVVSPDFQQIPGLRGEGVTEGAALLQLADHLHNIVEEHHNIPPHRKNAENRFVSDKINTLIDWDLYRILNPEEQPLWGRIVRHRKDGGIDVYWFLGPSDVRNRETALEKPSVPRQLRALKVGDWFYGAGKALPDEIEWTSPPVKVPDPSDRAAVRQAWDRIPKTLVTDLNSWPERETE